MSRFLSSASDVARNPSGLIGLILIALPLTFALCAPLLSPYDPNLQNLTARLTPPSWTLSQGEHFLGTDSLGRDILSRVLYGARVSVVVGVAVVLIGGIVGTAIGLVSGYVGGVVDLVMMRAVDVFLALPFLLLALVTMAVLGPSLTNLILVLGLTSWVPYARVSRARVLALKEREFIQASYALGTRPWRILLGHVLPNAVSSVIVIASYRVATAIVAEATLSFLGLGVDPSIASWGTSLAEGRKYLLVAWWPATLPGIAIVVTVLGVNLLGDGIRDVLDPKRR